jgi:putative Mn2+ efflux pump MntP
MTTVEKKILGVLFIIVGIRIVQQVIKDKETTNWVNNVRALMGAICLILVGLVMIFTNIG